MNLIDADILRDEVLNDNTFDNDTVNYYLGLIDEQPTIDPNQSKWIPCSERLPHEVLDMQDFKQMKVLVCTQKGVIKTCLYKWEKDYNGNYLGWEFTVRDVIAWQPLPEPYLEV